jgi:hypothetical protein
MKRLVKVNSEMGGGNFLKAVSKRGLSSKERSLNCGKSGTSLQKTPMTGRLLFSNFFTGLND